MRFHHLIFVLSVLLSGCVSTQSVTPLIGRDWSPAWQLQASDEVKRNYFKSANIESLCAHYSSAYSGGMRDEGKRKYIRLELIKRELSPFACDNPEMDKLKRAELERNRRIQALEQKNRQLESQINSLRQRSNSDQSYKDGHRAGCVMNGGVWSNGSCQ